MIEAAKLGNMSKILGRSKSEDSVYNSMNSPIVQQGIKVSYAQDTGQYSSDNNSTSSNGNANVNGGHGKSSSLAPKFDIRDVRYNDTKF